MSSKNIQAIPTPPPPPSLTLTASILRLTYCVAGIYICYLSYGIFQEKIFHYKSKQNDKFNDTLFLLALQCFANTLIAYLASIIWRPTNKIPAQPFAFTAFSYVGAMLCSNEALKYVSYPTQALGKSCKMIPVMLMGVLLRGKKYTLKEYLCVIIITAGITVFQLGKMKAKVVEEENSWYGLFLLFTSLSLDGITGPKQEELIVSLKPSVHQQMMYTNLWAFFYTFGCALVTGQMTHGLAYCLQNPELWLAILFFCICSALGQNFIFYTIQSFSALACTTITTTRKFFTILCSVVYFGHSLSSQSWLGVYLVFIGLGWELLNKFLKHKNKQKLMKKE